MSHGDDRTRIAGTVSSPAWNHGATAHDEDIEATGNVLLLAAIPLIAFVSDLSSSSRSSTVSDQKIEQFLARYEKAAGSLHPNIRSDGALVLNAMLAAIGYGVLDTEQAQRMSILIRQAKDSSSTPLTMLISACSAVGLSDVAPIIPRTRPFFQGSESALVPEWRGADRPLTEDLIPSRVRGVLPLLAAASALVLLYMVYVFILHSRANGIEEALSLIAPNSTSRTEQPRPKGLAHP